MGFAEGRVGEQILQDGVPRELRLGRLGELITVPDYLELMRNGRIFNAAMQAGANLGTALTATAVTFTLFNPKSSGVIVAILDCGITITTEPAVAAGAKGNLVYAANVDPAAAEPASTTALTIRNGLLGKAVGEAKAFSAATLPAAPVVVRVHPLALNNQTAAGDAQLGQMDYVKGVLGLMPGTAVTIQNIGTQMQGIVGMSWAEIPK